MILKIKGRPISKKNNRVASNNRFFTTSKRYKQWENEAMWQLKGLPTIKATELFISFYMKGRLNADLDNLITSVLDVLQKARVIDNDKDIVHIQAYKIFDNDEWETNIELTTK